MLEFSPSDCILWYYQTWDEYVFFAKRRWENNLPNHLLLEDRKKAILDDLSNCLLWKDWERILARNVVADTLYFTKLDPKYLELVSKLQPWEMIFLDTFPYNWSRNSEKLLANLSKFLDVNWNIDISKMDLSQLLEYTKIINEIFVHLYIDNKSMDLSNCNPFAGHSAETIWNVFVWSIYNPRIYQPELFLPIFHQMSNNPNLKSEDLIVFSIAQVIKVINELFSRMNSLESFNNTLSELINLWVRFTQRHFGMDCDFNVPFDYIFLSNLSPDACDVWSEMVKSQYILFDKNKWKLVLSKVHKSVNEFYLGKVGWDHIHSFNEEEWVDSIRSCWVIKWESNEMTQQEFLNNKDEIFNNLFRDIKDRFWNPRLSNFIKNLHQIRFLSSSEINRFYDLTKWSTVQ